MTEQELKASVLAKCREVWNNETNDPKVSGFRVHSNSGKYWDVHNYRRTVHYKLSDDIPADDNVWPLAAQILVIQAAKDKEVAELKAEIKRLREFAQQCFKSPEKLAVIHYFENGEFDYCDLVPLQDAAINSLSPAPVTEGKFSVSAYPKECVPTIEQLTENDGMSMMERLEKRMPPFHGFDSSKNEDQE